MRIWGIALALVLLISGSVFAFPNKESDSVDVNLSQSVQFAISSDNQSLYIAYANTFKIFDTGTFALATTQPFDINTDTTTYPGNYVGLIYLASASAVFLPMDNGTMMKFDLNNIATAPTILTVASGKKLANGVADTIGGNNLYILDTTDTSVVQYTISTATATQIPILPAIAQAGFAVTPQLNQIVFSPQGTHATSEVYVTTTTNMLVYFNLQTLSPQITLINSNSNLTDTLQGVYPTPNQTYVYVVDSTNNSFSQVQISNHSVVGGIQYLLSPNNQPNYLLITNVTEPTGVYGYVTGVQGVSIFDTFGNDILDEGVTSTDNEPLQVNGVGPMVASTDGYVYIDETSGNIGVVSDNPWVTISSVSYSGGGSLGLGDTATITFQSDEVGTYVTKVGGDVSGNGTLVVDAYGSSSGTVAAISTDQTIYIPYDANSSVFQEGDNSFYIFVTDSASNVGRIATTVSVDTPPTAVTVVSSSFGNTKAYINFNRLTANDINYYNIYADTDPVTVTTKTAVSATLAQGSSAVLTGVVTGLANGTLYYLAIEGVDNAGNIGPRTSTFSGGALITATPEFTVGPAGYSGGSGCSLMRGND